MLKNVIIYSTPSAVVKHGKKKFGFREQGVDAIYADNLTYATSGSDFGKTRVPDEHDGGSIFA